MPNGQHYDPTYQLVYSAANLNDCHYYGLYSIPVDDYFDISESITNAPTGIVDFYHLRQYSGTKHLFITSRKKRDGVNPPFLSFLFPL